jgi:hypothetical protein
MRNILQKIFDFINDSIVILILITITTLLSILPIMAAIYYKSWWFILFYIITAPLAIFSTILTTDILENIKNR